MSIKKPVMADIQISELFYYDPMFNEEAYRFCCNLNIDSLPSLDDPKSFYRRNDDIEGFEREDLSDCRCIPANRFIFHTELLAKLRNFGVLFVFDADELTGVIHFSDYNNPIVSDFLYTRLAAYERSLRQLAELKGFTYEDMVDFFEAKIKETTGKEKDHYKARHGRFKEGKQKSKQISTFQPFFMDDLIGFLKHKGIIELQEEVRELRNSVMHAHEMVNMEDVTTPDFIYDFKTFSILFKRVRALLDDALRVENKIRFLLRAKSLNTRNDSNRPLE